MFILLCARVGMKISYMRPKTPDAYLAQRDTLISLKAAAAKIARMNA